jgi:hypothetical protein
LMQTSAFHESDPAFSLGFCSRRTRFHRATALGVTKSVTIAVRKNFRIGKASGRTK